MKATPSTFNNVAETFAKLGETASSLAMIDILADLFKRLSPEESRLAAYLVRGSVGPDYKAEDFGVAEKLVMRAIARAVDTTQEKIQESYFEKGDLGIVAELFANKKNKSELSLQEVFDHLIDLAHASGEGSQDTKISIMAEVLAKATPLEAKYIVKIILGALRLGVAEMTFLNALSVAVSGSKKSKKVLEKAYNILSDLGEVAYRAKKDGASALFKVVPEVGVPIRVMLAQRVAEISDVEEHMPGKVVVEYKYDGERVQAHIKSGEVTLYSRRHDNITHQFPDVVKALKESFVGKNAIVEGEAVAFDTETGHLKDFQTMSVRRRKHDIAEYANKVPLQLFLFDILFADGQNLMEEPILKRQEYLQKHLKKSERIVFTKRITAETTEEIETFFEEAIEFGAEGIMIKSADSQYQAGSRGWNWIKFKKDYREGLADSFDLVVVGGLYGVGRRAGTYGSLLLAAFDEATNTYKSFTKVGAGFTDEDLLVIPKKLDPLKIPEKHRLVDTGMKPDVWFEPKIVVEIIGTEITVSPIHTVAKETVKRGGLALRFPRFMKWRTDKRAEQATTTEEILELYQAVQKKRKK
jgi:DNA ligase-1